MITTPPNEISSEFYTHLSETKCF